MKRTALLSVFFCVLNIYAFAQKANNYTLAPKDDITNKYHGETIEDPYQWMENPDDPRLQLWLKEQAKLTRKIKSKQLNSRVLEAQIISMYVDVKHEIKEGYKEKEDSLKSKFEFDYNYSSSKRSADLRYRLRGKKNYKMVFRIKDHETNDNKNLEIENTVINDAETYLAIEVSKNGSDWRDVYIFDLLSGQLLPEKLVNLRASSSLVWLDDTLYYDAFNAPKKGREGLDVASGQKFLVHKLKTNQSEDKILYKNVDTTGVNNFSVFKLKDKLFFNNYYPVRGKTYRALSVANVSETSFFLNTFLIYPNTNDLYAKVEELFGNNVLINTNWNAPNGRVLKANITELNNAKPLVQQYDVILKRVNKLGKDKFACIYNQGGSDLVLIHDLEGKMLRKISFPEGKQVKGFYENEDNVDYTVFYVSSFYHPAVAYQLSLKNLEFKPISQISVPYKVEDLETRYVTYKSSDGTMVPMYITCLKDTELNGKNPTLIYGYGGYGVEITPGFNKAYGLWLLHGGVLAVPSIRGGGAKGNEWRKQGSRLHKKNAINDFISAAEFLIESKYTNPDKIAIRGGSHGGLLVASSFVKRPDLFKTVIAEAGVYDMLRFENYTAGGVNTNLNEFGTVTNLEDFNNLKSYSPLHNLKKGVKYPNVLLVTGDSDDRVPPLHSYKFLAALQELGDSKGLYSMYVVPGAGHGGALTPQTYLDKLKYVNYYLFKELGVDFK